MNTLEIETASPEATECVGAALAAMLRPGAVVTLQGDLATGKTCLVRGMAACLSDAAHVHSPTFTLVNEYPGPLPLYHLDLYRLSEAEELADLGYEELFDSDGVCAVEWAERAGPLAPTRCVQVDLAHAGGDRRRLRFQDRLGLPDGWQEALKHAALNVA